MALTETTGVVGTGRLSYNAIMKDVYGPRWEDEVHSGIVLWKMIGVERGKMGGRRTLTAVVDSFPQSTGIGIFEDGALPTPRSITAFNPELIARYIYMRMRWTGPVELAARMGDKAAWGKPRAVELELAEKQFKINLSRMAYLGYYQPVAIIKSYASPTVTLYGRNARTSTVPNWFYFGTQFLRKNQSVSLVTAAQGVSGNPLAASIDLGTDASAHEAIVTAIDTSDVDNPTATLRKSLDTSVAVENSAVWNASPAVDDILIPYNSRRGTPADQSDYSGFNGLANMIGDTNLYSTVYGLSRATYPTLSGQRLTNGGNPRIFDSLLENLLVDKIADDGIGEEPSDLLCHRSVRREVLKDTKDQQRYPPVQSEHGFAKLAMSGGDTMIPYTVDRDCPPGIVFGINTRFFGYLQNAPMEPIDQTGDRFVSGKDAREVIMRMGGNLFCTAPLSNGMLEDVPYDVQQLTSP